MRGSIFMVVCVCWLGPGCGEPDGRDVAGGDSGAEGGFLPCDLTGTAIAPDEPGDAGFSAEDLLARVGGERTVTAVWHPLDAGPAYATGEDTLTFVLEARGESARSFACKDPDYPRELIEPPRLEVPVTLRVRSGGGQLDEEFETVLAAQRVDHAWIDVGVEPGDMVGSLGPSVDELYSNNKPLWFYFAFSEEGPRGYLFGPSSLRLANPCGDVYATWPLDVVCYNSTEEEVPSDPDALEGALTAFNRSVSLSTSQGTRLEATLTVELQGATACRSRPVVLHLPDGWSHPAAIALRTPDGGVGLSIDGWLRASPQSSDDPLPGDWSYDVSGHTAMAAAALRDAFGDAVPVGADVEAAHVDLWAAAPSAAVDGPAFDGRLLVESLDREGFSTVVPIAGEGGGSCHAAPGGVEQLMSATIRLP